MNNFPFCYFYKVLPLHLALIVLVAWPYRSSAITYEVEPCCSACEAVLDINSYTTRYLKNVSLLTLGREGWLFRSEKELTTVFGPDDEALTQLTRFHQQLLAKGSQLVMILPPTKGLVHPDKVPGDYGFDFNEAVHNFNTMSDNIREVGIVVPDMSSLFAEQPDHKHGFYFRRDHHWTPDGAKRAAELVANEIKAHPLYASLSKQPFTSRRIGLMGKQGSHQVAWHRICNTRFPTQYVNEYRTAMAESEDDGLSASDLFGEDIALPEITLVGTSFSNGASDYNFAGFLKEYLSVDVLNEAMAGGSYDGALVQYLPSEEFQQTPPVFLFWEVPSYHRLNSEVFYRQVNAYVEGGCSDKPRIFESRVSMKDSMTEVLFNGSHHYREYRGKGRIVDIQFSSPDVKDIEAHVWYTNGRKEVLKIGHGKRVDNNGRFVFLLKEGGEWDDFNFLALKVQAKDVNLDDVSVSASACRSSFPYEQMLQASTREGNNAF